MFKGAFDSDEEWLFDRRPITDAGNEAEILRSWLKTAEVYLESRLVRMISMRVPMFMDLGLFLVGSLIIYVRLRASRLDCRTAGC